MTCPGLGSVWCFCPLRVSVGGAKSTLDRRSALHLFRLGEAMLRIVRSKNRPLLHTMRAWSVVAPHLVEVRSMSANMEGEGLTK